MKEKYKYLLVCEGPTDITFLKHLINKLGADLGKSVEVVELAPQRDATTGTWPAHGCTEVRSWCKSWKIKTQDDLSKIQNHFIELAKRRNWKALVATSGADGLIIQMDTDIAEQISDLPIKFTESDEERRNYCQSAIYFWIGESDEVADKPFLLLPSFSMETWLLATHAPEVNVFDDLAKPFNYEEIIDLEQRLVSIGYSYKTKKGIKKLAKKESEYIGYADRVHANFIDVATRCKEANHLQSFLIEKLI